MTPRDVLKMIEQKKVQFIDLRFMDFPGLWQHLTLPVSELTLESFNHGFGFDGSSIRGWQAINESDMLLVPVADTARIDPFMQHTTLSMISDVRDPITKKEYSRDPRSIARKAVSFLQKTKIADRAMFGPELEFFIFDYAWYDQGINYAKYQVGSREGIWTRGDEDVTNLGQKIRLKEGYFPCPPIDTMHNIRSEMVSELINLGIPVEAHHHEVATGGQCEIDMRYQDLLKMADNVMIYKYVAKNVAARHGKVATFMPKPLFQDNGSGMHIHFSLWKGDKPLFAGNKYAGLSQLGLWAIGGILKHARALCALCNPTTNSYKRLVPGYEAPVNLVYSSRNRSAAIRIPMYSEKVQTKRIEFRCPDSSCNPYLAFSAMTMAAIDGIQNKIDPGDPLDKDIYRLTSAEYEKLQSAPINLEEALDALENDHDFLLSGDVFTADVIHYWIKYKRENEVEAIRVRPHPYEFCMYFDI
ncbi:type I glutamate--ammonia ligase [Humisphaera borealis]|uniref:Glutamine synthetase n=1 Tax=Humisphaera borealis TaxID=2807512 RepID=A0A7M2WTI9_9BACT|nr:type I glutamate--ammonia ligase [Humisphaera borealis]QOV88749.1 type I glutamate--ammonia ligase [Humisphaera borealis]